jgi:hypothetical protein
MNSFYSRIFCLSEREHFSLLLVGEREGLPSRPRPNCVSPPMHCNRTPILSVLPPPRDPRRGLAQGQIPKNFRVRAQARKSSSPGIIYRVAVRFDSLSNQTFAKIQLNSIGRSPISLFFSNSSARDSS